MKQFEIWWADLPKPAGRRPVLLLGRDKAYEYLNKYIAAEITTTIRDVAQEVLLGRREGLPKKCAASFDNLRTVPRSALLKRLGELGHARRWEAKQALGFALAWQELVEAGPAERQLN